MRNYATSNDTKIYIEKIIYTNFLNFKGKQLNATAFKQYICNYIHNINTNMYVCVGCDYIIVIFVCFFSCNVVTDSTCECTKYLIDRVAYARISITQCKVTKFCYLVLHYKESKHTRQNFTYFGETCYSVFCMNDFTFKLTH